MHVISRKQKGFSKFIQWSAFLYDKKGPYHIQEKETKEEKASYKLDIDTCNAAKYEMDKRAWEEQYKKKHRVTRAKLIPPFKHTTKWGLIEVKKGRGGINWYRYQEKILRPKLLPFTKKCLGIRPKTIV